MVRPLKTKTYSRRELLFGFLQRFQQKELPGGRTGFDYRSREIDKSVARGEFADAVELLEELLSESPDHKEAQKKLGYCYYKLQELDKAIEALQRAMHGKGKDNFCLLYLGLAQIRKNQISQAMQTWKHYFDVQKPLVQRAINLHLALYESGGPDSPQEIAQSIEKAIEEQQSTD